MFNNWRRRFRGGRNCPDSCGRSECINSGTALECVSLSQGEAHRNYRVSRNADAKTREMGLYPGAEIHIIKNHRGDPSVVIAAGEARYAIHRDIAELIMIRLEQ